MATRQELTVPQVTVTAHLKISKQSAIALVGVVNAGLALLDSVIFMYLPPTLATPTTVFVSALANVVLVYLSTYETESPQTPQMATASK